MKVTIIIPTCSSGRIPMLIRTVESIQAGSYKNIRVVIVADGNPQIYDEAKKYLKNISVIMNEKRRDWVFSINWVLKNFESDYYIYASDDLIFPPDCIKHAMETMQKRFPDGFGVIDIGKKNKSTFGLFGRKFADHFPNREVMCPDFIHYCGDSELRRIVKEMGKYAYPPERASQVKHFRMNDETRILARRVRARDRAIYYERKEKGYKWGIDFNLVTRK